MLRSHAARIGLEMLARQGHALLFRQFRHAQAQIRQGNLAPRGHGDEQQAADGHAEAAEDGQGQPVQQPHEGDQQSHAGSLAASGVAGVGGGAPRGTL
jgi:hypothetical protein